VKVVAKHAITIYAICTPDHTCLLRTQEPTLKRPTIAYAFRLHCYQTTTEMLQAYITMILDEAGF
jgi:hypothetical protein